MYNSNNHHTASTISLQNHQPLTDSDSPLPPSFTSYPAPTASYDDVFQSPDLFWEKLKAFHISFGTKFAVPTMGGRSLDLYRLFVEVTSRGGFEQVINNRRWKEIALSFGFPSTITSASFVLRKYYLALLYHFEQVYLFHKQAPSMSVKGVMNETPTNGSLSTQGEDLTADELPVSPTGSPVLQLGCDVTGTIDGKFDNGYLVTVQVGANKLKGVLYHVPQANQKSQSSITPDLFSRRRRKRNRDVLHDHSRPKSHRSGYNFFFAEHYARLKQSYHGQVKLISKQIGELWNNLKEEEKQVYQDEGQKDLERYRAEMSEYRSSLTQ